MPSSNPQAALEFDCSLGDKLPWLTDVSVWSLPPKRPATYKADSFYLGGNGRLTARMGQEPRYSTMDRILGPYLHSYAFYNNYLFRVDIPSPTRDFWPPLEFHPTHQWLWRVRGTSIILTKEVDDTFAFYSANFVHPNLPALFRIFILKNVSKDIVRDIGIGVDAPADIPWPGPGHRSVISPHGKDSLLEVVSEPETKEPFTNQPDESRLKRRRYLLRKLVGGRTRGFQNIALTVDELHPSEELVCTHYLAVSTDDLESGALESAAEADQKLESSGVETLLQETKSWWEDWKSGCLSVSAATPQIEDVLDSTAILEKVCESRQGCFSVIEDYTFPFIRDLNGPHKYLLRAGKFDEVRRSMDYIYAMDVLSKSLRGAYPFDIGIPDKLPPEPDWEKVDPVMLGDVPNFRVLWYDWYVRYTGDLDYVSRRFNYLLGMIRRQRVEENGYLAGYSYDETYGLGPVQEMRRGQAADNSFIFVAACERLAYLGQRTGRSEESLELQSLANKVRQSIESKLWLEDRGHYAMRIDEHGRVDPTPISPALLRPIWTGYACPDDERAVRSVEYVLEQLCVAPGFIKILPGDFLSTVGHIMAYLLYNLCEMNHPKADWAFEELMRYVDPGGTFSEYYDYALTGPVSSRRHGSHFARPWESGVNADIVAHYLTGFSPNALERKFTLKPRVPPPGNRLVVRAMRIRNSPIHLSAEKHSQSALYEISIDNEEEMQMEFKNVLPTEASDKKVEVAVDGKRYPNVGVKRNRWNVPVVSFGHRFHAKENLSIEIRW